MRRIEHTRQFKRDYKREARGRHRAVLKSVLPSVISALANDVPLANKCQDHSLTGNWKDFRDCHVKPDLVLIYRKPDSQT
jgi:mRNA interferase YafQ